MTNHLVGIVLAGGESRRFGSPKAFAKKDGMPFYHYSIEGIKPFVASILVVTNPKLQPLFDEERQGIRVVNDLTKYRGKGPLAGIYTAMETLVGEWYIVIPIDVPFIKPFVYDHLIKLTDEEVEAIVPVVYGKSQPLLSIYHYSMYKWIGKQLDKGVFSVHQLLKERKVKYVPIDMEKPFININRKTDYHLYIQGDDEQRDEKH